MYMYICKRALSLKHMRLLLNEQAEEEAVRVACLEADTDVSLTQNVSLTPWAL